MVDLYTSVRGFLNLIVKNKTDSNFEKHKKYKQISKTTLMHHLFFYDEKIYNQHVLPKSLSDFSRNSSKLLSLIDRSW